MRVINKPILYLFLAILSGFFFSSCLIQPLQPLSQTSQTITSTGPAMIPLMTITDAQLDRSFYLPGESVHLNMMVQNNERKTMTTRVVLKISHLTDIVAEIEKEYLISIGWQIIEITFLPPKDAPRGYGIDFCIETADGVQIDCGTVAFDVLQKWTQTPRYGFLSDFFPGRANLSETTDFLVRYHINGLQFYDWMYRHEQFLTEQEPYTDLLGRNLSRVTVKELIAAAHEKNIACMPYTAIYAASTPFYEKHPDWALYQANGRPYLLGENFLVYMDPRPDSPWVKHLLAQFSDVFQEINFDGIHLDQYGDPKEGYDARGNKFSLADPLAETIDATKELVLKYRRNGAVVFNAVTNWPIETISKSGQDFIYIEVWPPYRWFDDLHNLITQAQDLSSGKPVILVAYIDPGWENNVRLVDAVIFASGGGHIELGEINGMLSDPYFPKYKIISPELLKTLRRYYDFAVRYQDVIGPRTTDATGRYLKNIQVNGVSLSPSQLTDKVWPIVRETGHLTAISFINLLGIKSPEWAREIKNPPSTLKQMDVQISEVSRNVSRVWFASPDGDTLSLQSIDFSLSRESGRKALNFKAPYLEYWDLILIEWGE